MAIYDANGTVLTNAYDSAGALLNYAYDAEGNVIHGSDPYIPGRELVFEDNFDGADLDTTVWSKRTVAGYNGMLQYWIPANVVVEDGCLKLIGKKENYEGYTWTSGYINSKGKFSFLYGRIEAKIKFPKLKGAFPAFWLMGDNDLPNPRCGEIDIVEIMPGYNEPIDKVYANLWNCDTSQSLGNAYTLSQTVDDWHIYAMEWTADYIAILFDGVEFKRWTFLDYSEAAIARYKEAQYILFDLAIGTGSGGTPEATTDYMEMDVAWLRIYAPLT